MRETEDSRSWRFYLEHTELEINIYWTAKGRCWAGSWEKRFEAQSRTPRYKLSLSESSVYSQKLEEIFKEEREKNKHLRRGRTSRADRRGQPVKKETGKHILSWIEGRRRGCWNNTVNGWNGVNPETKCQSGYHQRSDSSTDLGEYSKLKLDRNGFKGEKK